MNLGSPASGSRRPRGRRPAVPRGAHRPTHRLVVDRDAARAVAEQAARSLRPFRAARTARRRERALLCTWTFGSARFAMIARWTRCPCPSDVADPRSLRRRRFAARNGSPAHDLSHVSGRLRRSAGRGGFSVVGEQMTKFGPRGPHGPPETAMRIDLSPL